MIRIYLTLFLLIPVYSFALTAENRLADPAKEARAHEIFKQIRCVVCSGESINDSNADIAREMRVLIRDEIKSGATNEEIINSIANGYGQSILMKPPLNSSTYILWFAPLAVLLFAIVILIVFFRKK